MTNTGYVFHPSYLLHDTGAGHPESAARLEAVMAHLRSTGLLDRLVKVDARRATPEEISLVHTAEYQSRLAALCRTGSFGGRIDDDTPVSSDSCDASEYALGGAVAAVEAVMNAKVSNCFALLRPPGHHAFPGYGSGFCLYNNVAVAACYARQKYNLKRIVLIDFDVHHGNGTQAIFDGDADTLYISTHQYPHYPGSGSVEDTGMAGTAVNIPLPAGCGDSEYLRVFDEVILPVVKRFKPELVLVSAGYDAHRDDPLADMRLSTGGYAMIAARIKSLAEECCGGRLVLCLEGGYNLKALAESVAATFAVLLGDAVAEGSRPEVAGVSFGGPDISDLITDLKRIHRL